MTALPRLLHRLAVEDAREGYVVIGRPVRVPRSKLVRDGELEKAIEMAWLEAGGRDAPVLVLIDADDDCPARLGAELLERAQAVYGPRDVSVVLAKREFESWFLAAPESIRGVAGLPEDFEGPEDPEGPRDAKGVLDRAMGPRRAYSETVDQQVLAGAFDLRQAETSRSFRKLRADFRRIAG